MMMISGNGQSKAAGRLGQSLIYLCVCLSLLIPACTQTPTPTVATAEFSFVTDPSTAAVAEKLVSAYQIDHPNVTVELERSANAERALEALRGGQFDLAAVSWLPEDEKAGGALWHRPFARDSIVIVTHPANPVSGLTLTQLRSIFQGQALTWTEFGGPAVDVIPVSRESDSGTRLNFESLVMGRRDVSPTAVLMPSHEAVIEFVSSTPGAIGYVAPGWLAPSVNLLSVEGVTPSPASVEDGRYFLARPYYLIATNEPDGGQADFVAWVLEGAGQEIVRKAFAPAP
jgi:phosphate transport system substrate-binding protein